MNKRLNVLLLLIIGISLLFSLDTYQKNQILLTEIIHLEDTQNTLITELSTYQHRYEATNKVWDLVDQYEYFDQSNSLIDQQLALYLPTVLDDPYAGVYSDAFLDTYLTGETEPYTFGLRFFKIDNSYFISYVAEESSAREDGIIAGDKILSFNHKQTYKWNKQDLSHLFSTYDKIHIEILNGDNQTEDYMLRKRYIKQSKPRTKLLTDDIAYVHFKVFDNNITLSLYPRLKEFSRNKVPYLILDLRDNLGGNMIYGHNIINFFSSSIEPYILKNKFNDKYIGTLPFAPELNLKDFKTDFKIYIIVNRNSASASEFVASSLREHENAILIGEQSRGKGVMQEFFLINDDTYAKLTTHEFYPSKGNEFHKIGVTPDYIVESRPWVTPDVDEALEKALELIEQDQ